MSSYSDRTHRDLWIYEEFGQVTVQTSLGILRSLRHPLPYKVKNGLFLCINMALLASINRMPEGLR